MTLPYRLLTRSLLLFFVSTSAHAQGGASSEDLDPEASAALEGETLGETVRETRANSPYFVIGHRRLLQQLHEGNRAWTLGDDGAVVAWSWDGDVWTPQAIRQFPDATALSLHGEDLQITTPQFVERVRTRDLRFVARLPASVAIACGERLSWRLDQHQRLCAKVGGAPSVCSSDAPNIQALEDPVCTIDEVSDVACLTVRAPSGAASWCIDPANVIHFHQHNNEQAVAHPQPDRVDWMVRTFDGWQLERDASAVMNQHRQNTWATPCYLAGPGAFEACLAAPPVAELETQSVSAQILQDVLTSDSALYFIFRDGWYAQRATDALAPLDGVRHRRVRSAGDERTWLIGEVFATGLYQGDAYVAACESDANQWLLRVLNIDQGSSVIASQGEGHCPERADFHGDVLRLSFENRAEEWSLATESLHDADIRSPFRGAISGDLVARAEAARHCSSWAWDISLESPTLGRVPLSRRACARSVASTRWASDAGHSHGPALIMSGVSTSHVFMIDEDTLESFSLRTPGLLSPRTRIHRSKNGSWLLSDPKSGLAQRFGARGETKGTEQALIVGQHVWTQLGHGALRNEDGNTALVTDAGLALGELGAGPLAVRTLRASMARLLDDAAAFGDRAARWFTSNDQ